MFPQRLVLGSLLFILYINDLYKASSKFQVYLFADDTSSKVNLKTSKVNLWLVHNKLTKLMELIKLLLFSPFLEIWLAIAVWYMYRKTIHGH